MPVRVPAMPLSPAVALGGFDAGAVMDFNDVRQSTHAQRAGVIFVGGPRFQLHVANRFDDLRIMAKGQLRPFFRDLSAAQIRIPRQAAEAVEIRHRERVREPVGVEADIGHAGESTNRVDEKPFRRPAP